MVFTPEGLYCEAQGREAHPGEHVAAAGLPRRGLHYRILNFQDELRRLLPKYGNEFGERYTEDSHDVTPLV